MNIRTWRTNLDLARVDEYENFAQSISLPMFRQQQGYVGVLMSRSGSTRLVTSFWRSMEDVERLDRSASYQEVVRRIRSAGFLKDTQTTGVAEVHLFDWLGRSVSLAPSHPKAPAGLSAPLDFIA